MWRCLWRMLAIQGPIFPFSIDDTILSPNFFRRRTNPVEILYASFPAFLFLNTTLAGKLLEPLLEFQDSWLYGNDYAAPDLGTILCINSGSAIITLTTGLGSSWPIIQGNTTDQSLLAIDSRLLLEHLAISGALSLTFWISKVVGQCSSWHWHTLKSRAMEHCCSTTIICYKNGQTTWCKAQKNQVHSDF